MLFFSVTFENVSPYQNVVTYSEVRDEFGERMSKTKKNGIPFDNAVAKMSADAMRWLYCLQKSSSNVNFGYNIADSIKREFILILWNSYRFFTQHANLENWQPDPGFRPEQLTAVLDRWLLSRLHSTISQVSKSLNHYNTAKATESIQKLVSDLSTWYIRRNRNRNDNLNLLYHTFEKLTALISPFVPFISEIIHRNLSTSILSVHLESWPNVDKNLINIRLEKNMDTVRKTCQDLHALRQLSGLKIRQPLSEATIIHDINDEFLKIILDETNIKKITVGKKPSLNTTLTPDLIAEGKYRDFVREVQILRKNQGLKITDKITIVAPTWPKEFEADLLTKTLAVSIKVGCCLKIALSP